MIKSILKRIWNQRKSNAWIMSELCIVFILLWYATDFLFVHAKIGHQSKGYNTEHVYKISMDINPLLNIKTSNMDSLQMFKIKPFKEIVRRVKSYPGIESVCYFGGSDSYNNWNMFQGYSIDSVHVYTALIRYTSKEYMDVFKLDIVAGTIPDWDEHTKPIPAIMTKDLADSLFNGKVKLGTQFFDYYAGRDFKYKLAAVAHNNKIGDYNVYEKGIFVPMDERGFEFQTPIIAVRVAPNADHNFVETFMKKMKKELQVNPYYLFNVQSYDDAKEIYEAQAGTSNYIKGSIAFVLFFIINIFLGIIGTFWFRTQSRSSEIGLRVALGSTKQGLRWWMVLEGIMLLNIAVIPAIIIAYNIGGADLTFNKLLEYSLSRFIICSAITYLFMAIMVVFGVWYPSKVASNVLPVEALRDE